MTQTTSRIPAGVDLRHYGEMQMDENALSAVAAILWDERQQLEQLLFTLVSQQLIVASGQTRWLPLADAQVQQAMSAVRDAEVLRAIEIEGLTGRLGVDPHTTLAELAQQAPEPWSQTLSDHRLALRALAAEIDGTVAENRRLLQAGAQAIGDTLSRLGEFTGAYDARGGAAWNRNDPTFLDEQA